MSDSFAQRLQVAGYALPAAPATASTAYAPVLKVGSLLYIAGQISQLGDTLISGRVGAEVSLDIARRAAELCAVNLLAQLATAVEGDLTKLRRAVRLGVFIAAVPEFAQHSSVGDAASGLLTRVLGPQGVHVRTSVGVASLPRGATVEAEALFELAP